MNKNRIILSLWRKKPFSDQDNWIIVKKHFVFLFQLALVLAVPQELVCQPTRFARSQPPRVSAVLGTMKFPVFHAEKVCSIYTGFFLKKL